MAILLNEEMNWVDTESLVSLSEYLLIIVMDKSWNFPTIVEYITIKESGP
jgi:hypothetical protein